MRVLIQNCLTKKFLAGSRAWTAEPEKAVDFETSLRAWGEIDERSLTGVQIIVIGTDEEEPLAKIQAGGPCGERTRLGTRSGLRTR